MNFTKTILLLTGAICLTTPLSAVSNYNANGEGFYSSPYRNSVKCAGINPQDYKHVPYYNPRNPCEPLKVEESEEEDQSEESDENDGKNNTEKDVKKERSYVEKFEETKIDGEEENSDNGEKEKCACPEYLFSGDFLYWKGHKCLLDFAIPYDSSTGYSIGKVRNANPRWGGGFRLGFIRQKEGMQVGIKYTHFDNGSKDEVFNHLGKLAATRLDSQLRATQDGHIQWARACYRQKYDVVDLEAGYSPEIENFSIRAFGGVKLAFIDRMLNTRYAQVITDKNGTFQNPVDQVRQTANMDAYGLYFGFGGGGKVCGCFGLFGESSFGALLGRYERTFTQSELPLVYPCSLTKRAHLKDCCYSVVCNFDLAAGVSMEICGPCNNYLLKVGYEFHYWWNTPDFFQVGASGNCGPLGHILTRNNCGLGFDGLFVRLEGKF